MPNFVKCFEMSKKIPLTSTVGLSSKADCISCIMDSSWTMHEQSWTIYYAKIS